MGNNVEIHLFVFVFIVKMDINLPKPNSWYEEKAAEVAKILQVYRKEDKESNGWTPVSSNDVSMN